MARSHNWRSAARAVCLFGRLASRQLAASRAAKVWALSWSRLIVDCVGYAYLFDYRLSLVELILFAVRARHNGRFIGTLCALCLQGALMVLLKVVTMGTTAAHRRNTALCEASQRARANVPPDLKAALQAGTGYCPITHGLMHDPVRTCEWSASRPGVHVYEREAIEKWLLTSGMSPWTGLPLDRTTLEPCPYTRDLVTRLVAAQQIPVPLECRWDRALVLAADCAAAMGRIFLSDVLRSIDIDADVVCNRGGEGKPAVFVWTGSLIPPWPNPWMLPPRRGCAMPFPVTCPVFELFPGMAPMGFVQAPDGQVSKRHCKCCGQALPRGSEDLQESLIRTSVGWAMYYVGFFPFLFLAYFSTIVPFQALAGVARTVCVG